ncbi:MAG: phospholipase A [Proteobacteria bacterium]|nr:phospholipase A [Pseudomonadota bacterium]
MKMLQGAIQCRRYFSWSPVCSPILFLTSLFLLCGTAMADITDRMAECTKIPDDAARLKCFDDLTGRNIPVKTAVPATKTEDKSSQKIARPSVMSEHWELDTLSRKTSSIIRIHRPNYILPLAYNGSPNREPTLDMDRQARSEHTEAKFQISFKIKLWEDVMNKDVDLWFAYTQLSFWQLYNSTFSSPFRETDYEPELFLNFRTDYNPFGLDLFGLKGRTVNIGIDHQSNGRSRPLSRSWNRIFTNLGFEKDNFNLYVKAWHRLPESSRDDDNPNIEKYLGYGEILGAYYWNKHKFGIMLRNNLRTADNKGAIQLDWGFPFPFIKNDRFCGYIQYFNGYGESLLDYNANSNRISIGVILADWN